MGCEQTNWSGVEFVYLAVAQRSAMRPVLRAVLSCAIAAIVATTVGHTQGPATTPTPESVKRAEEILTEARKALGGEKLAVIKTLVASGRTRRVRGNNLVPIDFEIAIELPDKYVRADEFPAEDTDPTSSGFNGDALIQIPPPAAMPAGRGPVPAGAPGTGNTPPPGAPPAGQPAAPPGSSVSPPTGPTPGTATPPSGGMSQPGRGPMPPGARGPAVDPRRARTMTVKQDYARMALGLFAASPAYPLTFSYVAVAEAPQGQADVLEATGEGNFVLRFFVDSKTRLPIMVSWNTPPTNVIVTVPGQPQPKTIAPGAVVVAGPPAPAPNAPKEETEKYSKEVLALRAKAQATPVEQRLYFADYRDVDGVKFPFRLRRAIGSETTEETTFDRFRINSRIDPRKFEAVK
jgi:hypothetical protein